jgi:gas vesicle protein
MDTFKFWAAFSVGVAAGAVVALICAPQSGDKTRKQIRRKLEDAGEYVKDTASDLGDKASKVYKKGKETVSDYSEELVGNLQSAVKDAQARF